MNYLISHTGLWVDTLSILIGIVLIASIGFLIIKKVEFTKEEKVLEKKMGL